MDIQNVIRNLEHQYHSARAANPDWQQSLWSWLIAHNISPDDIWEYSPQIGYDADQPEPEWL